MIARATRAACARALELEPGNEDADRRPRRAARRARRARRSAGVARADPRDRPHPRGRREGPRRRVAPDDDHDAKLDRAARPGEGRRRGPPAVRRHPRADGSARPPHRRSTANSSPAACSRTMGLSRHSCRNNGSRIHRCRSSRSRPRSRGAPGRRSLLGSRPSRMAATNSRSCSSMPFIETSTPDTSIGSSLPVEKVVVARDVCAGVADVAEEGAERPVVVERQRQRADRAVAVLAGSTCPSRCRARDASGPASRWPCTTGLPVWYGEQVDGVRGVVPQQVVGPAARLAEGVGVRAAEEVGLHVHLLDRELAGGDPLVHPLVARVEPSRMAAHRDQPRLLLLRDHRLGRRPAHRHSGISTCTCLPASRQAIDCSACICVGVQRITASTSSRARLSASSVVTWPMPYLSATSWVFVELAARRAK